MKNSLRSFLVLVITSLSVAALGAGFSSLKPLSPRIDSVSDRTLGRAGRLRIFGSNFGATKSGSQVLIDGASAPVSRWSDTLVVAYVPEAARIAAVSVQIVTGAGSSNNALLDVKANDALADVTAAPQANGSIRWQFEVDGDYMGFRPSIGPDGTIYVQDVLGHLYALRPDGSVKWIFQGAYPAGPVAVGADNSTYIASGPTIQKISPEGALVWQFTDPDSQGVIGGPAVGPDGKVYAAMDLAGLGAVALSPVDGHLVWSNPGDPRLAEVGQLGLELVFGPASPGAQPDQFYFTCDNQVTHVYGHLYAFSLDGNQRWATSLGGISRPPQTAVAPNGTIGLGVAASNPSNGSVRWSAYSDLGSGSDLPPATGPDGTFYVVAQYQSALAALNGQTGAVLWRIAGVSFEQGPVVSPLNDVVVVGGRDNYGLPGSFKAFSTSGQSLWRIDLPGEPYPGMFEYPDQQGRFSLDGATVYMGTGISGEPQDNLHCYLYAIQTAETQTCPGSMNPTGASFTPAGGEGGVSVAAPNGCAWTAISNATWITITSGGNGSGNGSVNYSVDSNINVSPRAGTITAGSQTLTVNQTGIPAIGLSYYKTDFDSDGKTDIGFHRGGLWGWMKSSQSYSAASAQFFSWGGVSQQPICADFDGDGIPDLAYIAQPSGGQSATYAILQSSRNYSFAPGDVLFFPAGFPALGDTPVVGDFDGDGKADFGIWRASQGVWIIPKSSTNYTSYIFSQWGQLGDTPVIADFDMDGKADIGFYRNGLWGVLKSGQNYNTGSAQFFSWGGAALQPIVGDFDGDLKPDIGYIVPPSGGQSAAYAILKSTAGYSFLPGDVLFAPAGFPVLGDTAVVGDFDGDGRAEPGIWRESQGVWILPLSSSNYTTHIFSQWGQSGDIAFPNSVGKY